MTERKQGVCKMENFLKAVAVRAKGMIVVLEVKGACLSLCWLNFFLQLPRVQHL